MSFTCPGGWWKSSYLPDGSTYGLISEITTPGFHEDDHRMAELEEFARQFPQLLDTCRKYISI
jgi:predicted cupin superfamily sugar epimerase